ncbi:MAG: helical backbone metal receptor [Mariprofundaceae bacterium]|nr:helical backbone metal receptor [Mariprofundaceae bacterium]
MKWLTGILLLLLVSPALAAERILALTPAACEMMYAIGAGDELVGAGEYCDFPAAAKALPRVANYRQLYVEAALRQKPTLVIALSAALPGLDALKASGVRVFTSNPLSVADVMADMLHLGELSGHRRQAATAVAAMRKRLQALQKSSAKTKPRVFYEIWHEPLIAAGGGSLINSVLGDMGLQNVFADIPLEGPKVSVEAVLLAKPDIIMFAGDGHVQARKRFWRKWFKEKAICFVETSADLLHRPGPRLVQGMQALHAALKAKSCE